MQDGSGSTSWTYDQRGRVTQESKTISGGGTFVTAYTYDDLNRVKAMTYPDGEVVNTTYNAQGLPQSLAGSNTYVSATSHNALGQPVSVALGNTKTTQYTYDSLVSRLTRLQVGGSLLDLQYVYDAAGNITRITDVSNGNQQQNFGYDALDRLVSAATNGVGNGQYSEAYAYNVIGNITSKTGVGSYGYNDAAHKHAVTHLDGVQRYWYDANGNMTTRIEGGVTYQQTFDIENRLVSVTTNGQTTTFVYDGDGVRVKTVYPNLTVYFVGGYYKKAGGNVHKYYFLGGQPVAVRQAGVLYYLHGDHLGSVSLMTTDGGGISVEQRYYPYGETRWSSGTLPKDYQYTGQRNETTLGIYDYKARFYSPRLGRFLSADTVVPGAASSSGGGAATLGYNSNTRLTPLTVGFHEPQFLSILNAENAELVQFGPPALWSGKVRQEHTAPMGPINPQALNRYAYCLNNALRYVDPIGHTGEGDEQVLKVELSKAELYELIKQVREWKMIFAASTLLIEGVGIGTFSSVVGAGLVLLGIGSGWLCLEMEWVENYLNDVDRNLGEDDIVVIEVKYSDDGFYSLYCMEIFVVGEAKSYVVTDITGWLVIAALIEISMENTSD